MTLSFSQLGKLGRIGNVLFQAASTIGIARKNGLAPVFPKWEYERYFASPLPHGTLNSNQISESGYGYKPIHAAGGQDLVGYLQSPKYWEGNEAEIFDQFTFRKDFIDYFKTRSVYARVFEKPVIAIHIRRGDYVGNENYYQLRIEYYTEALKKHFPDAFAMNIMVFSDDTEWVKNNFPLDQNVTVIENQSEIDDLALMSLCQPAGTLIRTQFGSVPIEEVKKGDVIMSYVSGRKEGKVKCAGEWEKLIGRPYIKKERGAPPGRTVKSITETKFSGELVVIETSSQKKTRYTPDHICVAKVSDAFVDKYLVYLIRQGDKFRVGLTKPSKFIRRKSGDTKSARSDLRNRFNQSNGDECWVLSTHDNEFDAKLEEQFVSAKFGIPQVQFVGYGVGKSDLHMVTLFWEKFGENLESGIRCLSFYKRDPRYPFVIKGQRVNHCEENSIYIRACNMLDGMKVLDSDLYLLESGGIGKCNKAWVVIKKTYETYDGPVYSMSVDINETYVADGIITHNCDHWLIANSSFSWWAAYLGSNRRGGRVVRPVHHFAGPLAERADTKDLYPESWIAFDHEQKVQDNTLSVDQELSLALDKNIHIAHTLDKSEEFKKKVEKFGEWVEEVGTPKEEIIQNHEPKPKKKADPKKATPKKKK